MKQRIFTRLLCLVLVLVCALPALAWAEDTSRSYDFDLSVGGQQEVRAAAGETVTVTLVLKRTDKAESAEMYGMQTEILYDDSFFKLVEGSIMTAPGVRWSDMGRRTGGRAFYLNFVSFSGGEPWASEVTVGSFQPDAGKQHRLRPERYGPLHHDRQSGDGDRHHRLHGDVRVGGRQRGAGPVRAVRRKGEAAHRPRAGGVSSDGMVHRP